MVSLEEAIKIGKEHKPNAEHVIEYTNGYVFTSSKDEGYDGGLGHSTIVVQKSDGKVVNMMHFVNSGTGKEIKRKKI